jgi:Tol biopolymer transport system component
MAQAAASTPTTGGRTTQVRPAGACPGIDAANYRSPLVLQENSADRNGADGIHVGRGTIDDTNPSWSPDGRRIAFQSNRAGTWDVFVANSDGTDVRRLTTDPASDTDPQWSPDGTTIAFESAQRGAFGLYTINPDGSGLRKLADLGPDDPGFSWSPDGKQIAFGGDFLYVGNADGTGLRKFSDTSSVAGPKWSPDGTQIALQESRPTSYTLDPVHWLYVVNVDGSGLTPFSTFDSLDAAWSPDSTRIALNGITTVNADGSDLPFGTDLTPGSHPQWSPDGKQLAFESTQRLARLSDVFVANSNGSGRTNVTNSNLYAETRPVWSPDGSRIAYNVSGQGVDEVDTIRPDGSRRTSIVNDFPATLTANSADRNHALGIDVVPGVADGGGNSAKRNGDPRQCVGIECRP